MRGGAFAGQRMDGGFQNRQLASMKMMGKGKGKGKGKGSSMSSSKGSSSKSKKKNGFTIELMNMGDNTGTFSSCGENACMICPLSDHYYIYLNCV